MIGKRRIETEKELLKFVQMIRTLDDYRLDGAYYSLGDLVLVYKCDKPWQMTVRCKATRNLESSLLMRGMIIYFPEEKDAV